MAHILEGCTHHLDARELQEVEGPAQDLLQKIQTGKGARPVIRWLMRKLPEFDLALTYIS